MKSLFSNNFALLDFLREHRWLTTVAASLTGMVQSLVENHAKLNRIDQFKMTSVIGLIEYGKRILMF